jgi:glycosyltransferase involved in cell wall biosynthesis
MTRNKDDATPTFSIIIPVFNEEHAVADTIEHIHSSLKSTHCEYEIIAVNDGSTDGTGDVLRGRTDVQVLEHVSNQGYGAALKTGIRKASHSLIVITDADGTYPNDRIPELVSICTDYDMVVGARTGDNVTYPFIRKVPKFFLKRFAEWMVRQSIPDMNSGLRVFRKEVAARFFGIFPDGFSFTTTITLAMLTNRYRVRFEPIDYHARVGKSKIKPVRDTLRFVQLILRTGMYFAPLRVFLPVAMMFFLGFMASVSYDVVILHNLTDKSLILLVTATQTAMFALLADMIDKRSN